MVAAKSLFSAAALAQLVLATNYNATVVATEIETITSCGPEVTDCPARKESASVVTTVAPVVSSSAGGEVTVTATEISSVISCAPEVTDCPARHESASAVESSVEVTTVSSVDVTTVSCSETTAESSSAATAESSSAATAESSSEASAVPTTVSSAAPTTVAPVDYTTSSGSGPTTYVTVVEGRTITVVGEETSTSGEAPVAAATSSGNYTNVEVANAAPIIGAGGSLAALALGAMLL